MRSIRRHVLLWVMGAFALGIVVLAAAVYVFTMEEMSEVFDEQLKQIALSVLTHHQAQTSSTQRIQLNRPDGDEIAFITQVWTPEGRLLFSSMPQSTLAFVTQPGWSTSETTAGEWRVYTAHSLSSVVQAAQPVSARQALAADIAFKILIPGLIAVPAFALLLTYALARGLIPLTTATRDVERRSAQSLQAIDAQDLPVEIKPLVTAINALMSRVDEALSSQRRFIADAAHELRTPLTALKLQAQMLGKANDPDRRRDAVSELQNGIDRATHLVSQLLELSRLEPGSSVRAALATPLGEAAKSTVAQFVAQAERKGIDLGADVSPDVAKRLACIAPHEASILLNNLVDNALRYTRPGGRVDVAVRELPDSSRLELVVRDSGPGVEAAERSRVFDRFFRGTAAHNNPEIQGTGLGLAIVKSIVDMCGASVTLEHGLPNADGGDGLAVRITFKKDS